MGMDKPSGPVSGLEVVIKPSQEDLLRGQTEELLKLLAFSQEAVQFRVEFDVDFTQKTASNDLPDETEDEMLTDLNDVSSTNIDDGTANTLGGFNDKVVVLGHLKRIESLGLAASYVEDSFVNGVRHTIVDQLGQDQAILALVEHLEGIGGEGKPAANISVTIQHRVDVASEFGSFILVDSVGDVCARPLNLNLAADAALGYMTLSAPASALSYNATGASWLRASG